MKAQNKRIQRQKQAIKGNHGNMGNKKAFENNQYKQINISIKNIETKEIKDFTSFSSCSRYLNRSCNYIKSKAEKNDILVSKNGEKFEILRFKNVIPDKSWKNSF